MSDLRASGADVAVLEDRVVKRQEPFAARCERERTEWGERIGRESGLFRVPRVLECDEVGGEIVFERFHDGLWFGDAVRAGVPAGPLIERQALALAAIHAATLPGPAAGGGDMVSLHGDFCYGNLYYAIATDELWVIDWCNARWLSLPPERRVGSSSLDLAAFLISLFCHRFLVAQALPGVERLAAGFLARYAAGRGGRFDLATLRAELPGVIPSWRSARHSQAGWLRVALHGPGLGRLQSFLQRVELP